MKIAGAALNQTPTDWDNNLKNILDAIRMAKEEGVNLLCLTELCVTGYGCEDLFYAEWLTDKAFDQLLSILPSTNGIAVALGLPVRCGGFLYNTACLMENRQILGFVPKQNLANLGIYYEHRWFTPWKKGVITQVKLQGQQYPFGDLLLSLKSGLKVGFEICEDAWSQSRPGISLQERKVDIILNPSANNFAFGRAESRKDHIVKSSKDFDCWYVYTNSLGNEAGKIIYGGEVLIAKKGILKAVNPILSFKQVALMCADENSEPVYNFPDKNEEFQKAVSLGLYDYLRKSNMRSFTLSLSGGADSSVCAIMVFQMIRNGIRELGKEEFCQRIGIPVPENDQHIEQQLSSRLLFTAYQATKNSSEETYESAKELAAFLGANFFEWELDEDISSCIRKIEKAVGRDLSWEKDGVALENIQARMRSPVIWMLANVTDSLLITASNRSELSTGYTTMDGDTSGGLAPLAGVDKDFILKWLLWSEKELGYSVLSKVNSLQPSAELRPREQEQTDEGDLMPFDILVKIERLAFYEYLSPKEIYKKLLHTEAVKKEHLKNYVTRFFRLWAENHWKRERLAPGFHLEDFNVDPRSYCRFPVLSGNYREELEELKKLQL